MGAFTLYRNYFLYSSLRRFGDHFHIFQVLVQEKQPSFNKRFLAIERNFNISCYARIQNRVQSSSFQGVYWWQYRFSRFNTYLSVCWVSRPMWCWYCWVTDWLDLSSLQDPCGSIGPITWTWPSIGYSSTFAFKAMSAYGYFISSMLACCRNRLSSGCFLHNLLFIIFCSSTAAPWIHLSIFICCIVHFFRRAPLFHSNRISENYRTSRLII